MAVLRVFTAIQLPNGLSQSIDKAIRRNLDHPTLRCVSQDALHITLNFIGDVEDRETPALCKALSSRLDSHQPFEVQLDGLGAFPNFDRPRVLWIGVKEGSEEISLINQQLRETIEDFGFVQEKRFLPHLTVARVQNRNLEQPALKKIQSAFERSQWPAFTARSVIVFNSILEKSGPVYIPLATMSLTS